MTRNEWIFLAIYAGMIVVLCILFENWQIVIAVLGIMGFFGFMQTRRLTKKSEELGKKEK